MLRVGDLGLRAFPQQLRRPLQVRIRVARQQDESEVVARRGLALRGRLLEEGSALGLVLLHAAAVESHQPEGREGMRITGPRRELVPARGAGGIPTFGPPTRPSSP